MGMRVGGSAGGWNQASIGQMQQRQQNVKDLFASLQAGDLAGAQKAMGVINGNNSSNNQDGPFAAISKALASGDIQGAQQAAQAMQSHHHHHHAVTASAASSTSNTATAAVMGLGQNVNTIA